MNRSQNMARVRSTNTKPELYLRKLLWAQGVRYRINDRRFPGKPDIYVGKYRTAIFVNGCFWHMHACPLSTVPKTNTEFWRKKLERNAERDKENYMHLKEMKINVIVVWGCEIRKMAKDERFREEMLNGILKKMQEDKKRR